MPVAAATGRPSQAKPRAMKARRAKKPKACPTRDRQKASLRELRQQLSKLEKARTIGVDVVAVAVVAAVGDAAVTRRSSSLSRRAL
jgi:hypothetical protein